MLIMVARRRGWGGKMTIIICPGDSYHPVLPNYSAFLKLSNLAMRPETSIPDKSFPRLEQPQEPSWRHATTPEVLVLFKAPAA